MAACGLALLLLAGVAEGVRRGRRALLERRLAKAGEDFKALFRATAILGMDFCGAHYPPDTALRRKEDPAVPLTFEWSLEYYRAHGGEYSMLTTPVAYIKEIPRDPFRGGGRYYDYCAMDRGPKRMRPLAILRSVGPDGREDLPLAEIKERVEAAFKRNDEKAWIVANTPEFRGWVRRQVDPYLYDPTNGAASRGDLVKVMDRCSQWHGWGGSSELWAAVPPSRFSGDFELAQPAANWNMHGAPPEPKNYTDQLWAEAILHAPAELIHTLEKAGIVLEDERLYYRGPDGRRPVQERLDRLRNHFGPFLGFFERPAVLTADQREALAAWRCEDPEWWDAVYAPVHLPYPPQMVRVRLLDYLDTLVLYQKSTLLLAAEEMADGKLVLARHHLGFDRQALDFRMRGGVTYGGFTQGANWALEQDSYVSRVYGELTRLDRELREVNYAMTREQKKKEQLEKKVAGEEKAVRKTGAGSEKLSNQ